MTQERELLRRALEEIESQDADLRSEFEGFNKIWQGPPIIEEIRAFLAAEPEAEPVAWWFVYSDGSVADGQSYESEDDCVEAWAYEIESGLGKPEPFFRHPK